MSLLTIGWYTTPTPTVFTPLPDVVVFMYLLLVGLFFGFGDVSSGWLGVPDFAQASVHCISTKDPMSTTNRLSYPRRTLGK